MKKQTRVSRLSSLSVLSGILLSGLSGLAQAVTFNGYAYGEFSNPLADPADIVTIVNDDLGDYHYESSKLKWGASEGHPYGSIFNFDGTGSDTYDYDFSIDDGVVFSLGKFSYTNKPNNSGQLDGADLRINVHLCDVGLVSLEQKLGLETVSDGEMSRDKVYLDDKADVYFEYQGQGYTLEVIGFSRDYGVSFQDEFYVADHDYAKAKVFARIQAVPVPAAVWLFGSGLLALAGVMRKRKV